MNSDIVENNEVEIWKDINKEGLETYQVSSLGNLRRLHPVRKVLVPVTVSKLYSRSTGGIKDQVITIPGTKKHVAVRRIVCEVFNGPSPSESKELVVKLKDGNPLNLRPDNLYWGKPGADRKLIISPMGKSINLHDVILNETKSFGTIAAVSEFLDIDKLQVISMFKNYKDIPYKGKYLVSVNFIERFLSPNNSDRPIDIMNHYTGEQLQANNSSIASYITGISTSVVLTRCNRGLNSNLTNGYEFKYNDHVRPWSIFDREDVIKSRMHHEVDAYGRTFTETWKEDLQ